MIRVRFNSRRLAGGDAHEIAHLAETLIAQKCEHEEFAEEAPIDEADSRNRRHRDQLYEAAAKIAAKQ